MTQVKICGLTQDFEIAYANTLLPDYVGFVFAPSRRQVSAITAARLIDKLDARIQRVGVFVNCPRDEIKKILKECPLDILQFHGQESPAQLQGYTQGIWKSFPVRDADSLKNLACYQADAYLLDSFTQGVWGGSGQRFDWEVLQGWERPPRLVLAGGLSASNVRQAIAQVSPQVVDVSSAVESEGTKSFLKMQGFIDQVRESL